MRRRKERKGDNRIVFNNKKPRMLEHSRPLSNPERFFSMTHTFYDTLPAKVNPAPNACAPKIYPHGQPLTERAGASTVLGLNAYAFEFRAQSGEAVHSCCDAKTQEQKYALETVGGVVTSCNCDDRLYRRRVCKHMVELAVVLGTGLRMPQGAFVAAVSASPLAGPRTVAQALQTLREDYHAAAARAVILTAAAVEQAERVGTARPVVSGFDPSDIFSDWK